MPHFFPIIAPLQLDCSRSDLLRFDWQTKAADFAIPMTGPACCGSGSARM
jgi:hypothetical protein